MDTNDSVQELSKTLDDSINKNIEDMRRTNRDFIIDCAKQVETELVEALNGNFTKSQLSDIIKIELKLLMDVISRNVL